LGVDFRVPAATRHERTGRFGFEFRTLDIVPLAALPDVLRLVFYCFDASASPAVASFLRGGSGNAALTSVFDDFMLGASKAGSSAPVTKAYCDVLRRVFGAKISPQTPAAEALAAVSASLYKSHGQGRGRYSACFDVDEFGQRYASAPEVPDLNAAAAAYHRAELVTAKAKAKAKAKKTAVRRQPKTTTRK
jgi:hypothetical protein